MTIQDRQAAKDGASGSAAGIDSPLLDPLIGVRKMFTRAERIRSTRNVRGAPARRHQPDSSQASESGTRERGSTSRSVRTASPR